jgi:hypothetical protein
MKMGGVHRRGGISHYSSRCKAFNISHRGGAQVCAWFGVGGSGSLIDGIQYS